MTRRSLARASEERREAYRNVPRIPPSTAGRAVPPRWITLALPIAAGKTAAWRPGGP